MPVVGISDVNDDGTGRVERVPLEVCAFFLSIFHSWHSYSASDYVQVRRLMDQIEEGVRGSKMLCLFVPCVSRLIDLSICSAHPFLHRVTLSDGKV